MTLASKLSSATAATITFEFTLKSLMAPRKRMKASKTSATFYTASTVSTEKPHINPSATCNALNAAQKWIMQDPSGWETSLTKTSCESMMKENKSVAFKNSAKITKLLTLAKDEAAAPITYFVVDKIKWKTGSSSTIRTSLP